MRIPIASIILLFLLSRSEALAQEGHGVDKLPVQAFSEAIAVTDSAVILDVRTPEEFAEGHLADALNINWNDSSFEEHVALLDKSTPVYVYCRSGGRSHGAALRLRELGFGQVFDMQGGMMAWRAAALPEAGSTSPTEEGMDIEAYNENLRSNDRVLVDFYADWCVPCIKMKPYLERIQQDMGDGISVVRINIDQHSKVAQKLGVSTLPVLVLYENADLTWSHEGYLDEESIREQLAN